MATTGAEAASVSDALFVDTNVLVYANVIEAPEHGPALAAVTAARRAGRQLWISRQVIREYLTMMTRPQSFAMLDRQTLLDQVPLFSEQFAIADETAAVSDTLCQLMANIPVGGKQVHDANIVATMITYGIPAMLTHNTKDFKRFGDKIRIEALDAREKDK